MSMTTPIVDFVRRYAQSGTSRLHMPGHKGQSLLGFEPWDITEIKGADELYGCELFKKRMECAIMIKVAENQELAAKGIEVPIELGSTCNACADGEACE